MNGDLLYKSLSKVRERGIKSPAADLFFGKKFPKVVYFAVTTGRSLVSDRTAVRATAWASRRSRGNADAYLDPDDALDARLKHVNLGHNRRSSSILVVGMRTSAEVIGNKFFTWGVKDTPHRDILSWQVWPIMENQFGLFVIDYNELREDPIRYEEQTEDNAILQKLLEDE